MSTTPLSELFGDDPESALSHTSARTPIISRREQLEQWRAIKRLKAQAQLPALPDAGISGESPLRSTQNIIKRPFSETDMNKMITPARIGKNNPENFKSLEQEGKHEGLTATSLNSSSKDVVENITPNEDCFATTETTVENETSVQTNSLPNTSSTDRPSTLNEPVHEYDIHMLLLANDVLVRQIALSEARRMAESSRLREEVNELKMTISLQETRYNLHLERMQESMQNSLMQSLEKIQELTTELMSAHEMIAFLQKRIKTKADK